MAQTVFSAELLDEDLRIRRQMEEVMPSYDLCMRDTTLGREDVMREMTVDLASVKPGDWILEVGCGTGTLSIAAKRRTGPSGKVFGIDIIPGMIELSQRKAAETNETVTFEVGNIADIPFSANQFDVVMCSFAIFHMSEMVRRIGIGEVHRVLKPSGRLLILDLAQHPKAVPETTPEPASAVRPVHELRELLPLLGASGFAEVEMASFDFQILGPSSLAFVRGTARKMS